MALPMCLAALPAMLATVLLSGLAPAAAQPTSSGIAVAVVSGTGLATSLKVKLGEPRQLGLGQSRPFCLSLPPVSHRHRRRDWASPHNRPLTASA
jgi:hypothetical protein